MWIHSWLILDLLIVPLHDQNLTSLLDSPRHFNFVLLQGGVLREIPAHLKVWRVPNSDNTMYQKDLFKDWTSSHLQDYPWYVDCSKDNTTPLERKLWEKFDLSYLERLTSSEMEVRASGKKKVHDGAKEKGKGKVLDSNFEGEDSRVLEH